MTSTAPGTRIGSGKEAEAFEYGTRAVKLYRSAAAKCPAFTEAAEIAWAESCRLPVPAVHAVIAIEGRWGVAMERAEAPSFGDVIANEPGRRAHLVEEMVAMIGEGLP